jgi:hypothetical protein
VRYGAAVPAPPRPRPSPQLTPGAAARPSLVAAALIAALTVAPHPARAAGEKYTMADLKALGESKGWAELLEHAEDVRPSERQGPWKALVVSAATGVVDQQLQQKKEPEAHAWAEQLVQRFAFLSGEAGFMAKRRDAGLAAIGACFTQAYDASGCFDQLDRFVGVDPKDTETLLLAGKLVVEKGRLYAAAPPYFARAFVAPRERKVGCADPSVESAVLRAFGSPPHYDNVKAAATVAFEQCWDVLGPKVQRALLDASSYEVTNLCGGLLAKKAKLTAFQTAYCQDKLEAK